MLAHEIHSVICCFSGGKDSLVATHYTLLDVEDLGVDVYVIHVDTTCALPGVEEYIKSIAKELGWPLTILKPDVSFLDLAERWGMPTMRRRWCCYHLKLKPIIEFVKTLPGPRCEVTGLRRCESIRRRNLPESYYIWKRGSVAVWKYAPIIDWLDEDVNKYIKRFGLPVNPIYRLVNTSGECVCGVYTTPKKLDIIATHFPAWFQRFVELEQKSRKHGAAFYLRNRPLKAANIASRRRLTDWVEVKDDSA